MDSLEDFFTLTSLSIFGFFVTTLAISSLYILSAFTPWSKRKRAEFLRTEIEFNLDSKDEHRFEPLLKEDPLERPNFTPSSVTLSVVVPAMNEEERLPVMLDESLEYLEARRKKDSSFSYEIIVVDDGSTDRTCQVAAEYGRKFDGHVKVLKLEQNRGKGGTVRVGMLRARGSLILFADADGATLFSDLDRLEKELIVASGGNVDETFPVVAIGSRAHMAEESIAKRTIGRTILMHGFHMVVWLFGSRTIKDTQCGFKLFTRAAAAKLFPVIHIERWAFDVELIYLCELWKWPVVEVPVNWHEVDGSKITPIWSWLQMGRDLVLIWFRYKVGIWTDRVPE